MDQLFHRQEKDLPERKPDLTHQEEDVAPPPPQTSVVPQDMGTIPTEDNVLPSVKCTEEGPGGLST